jgi:5-dehydro-2-deoxygluconokinase
VEFQAGHTLHDVLRTWPAEHVIKCLVSYHGKDPMGIKIAQQEALLNLQEGAFATGHRWLLEVVPPNFETDPDSVVAAVDELYELGLRPDWWKLPPLTNDHAWSAIAGLIARKDPQCGGVVVLGYDKPETELLAAFESTIRSGCAVGFAIGRSIWRQPATDWFGGKIDDAAAAEAVRKSYEAVVKGWLNLSGQPMN